MEFIGIEVRLVYAVASKTLRWTVQKKCLLQNPLNSHLNRPLGVIFNARRLEENTQIYLETFSRVYFIHLSEQSIFTTQHLPEGCRF